MPLLPFLVPPIMLAGFLLQPVPAFQPSNPATVTASKRQRLIEDAFEFVAAAGWQNCHIP